MNPIDELYEGWDYMCECGTAMVTTYPKQWVCDSCGFIYLAEKGVSFEDAYSARKGVTDESIHQGDS